MQFKGGKRGRAGVWAVPRKFRLNQLNNIIIMFIKICLYVYKNTPPPPARNKIIPQVVELYTVGIGGKK